MIRNKKLFSKLLFAIYIVKKNFRIMKFIIAGLRYNTIHKCIIIGKREQNKRQEQRNKNMILICLTR